MTYRFAAGDADDSREPRLRGADPGVVGDALDAGTALPGTAGFAGRVDGHLVRDALGREPLFVDAPAGEWAFSPTDLADPALLPGGHALSLGNGTPTLTLADAREVWSLPDPDPFGDDRAAVAAVRAAIADVAIPEVPVAFSGGLDSGLVAVRSGGPLYVAGFEDSHDVEWADDAARALDADLHRVPVTHDRIREAIPEVVAATGRTNAMDVQIAIPLYLVARRVAEDGYDRLAVGQGADELFGGYAKVAKAPGDPRVEADTVRGAAREVIATLPDQLARDVPAIRAAGVEPVAPLLHDRVVDAALRLPDEALVDARGERKVALRRAAREWIPDRIAFREKKAVQYGSLVARELDRMARRAGFKRRMDDHVTRYVESLVDATDS